MRLVTFEHQGAVKIGALVEEDRKVLDFAAASSSNCPATMQQLIDGGDDALDQARSLLVRARQNHLIDRDDCRLLAPLPRPVQVRDCLCFPGHLETAQRVTGERLIAASPDPDAKRAELEAAGFFDVAPSFFDYPVYYITNRMAVFGPNDEISWPKYSQFIDYELEMAAIIGRGGASIVAGDARSHIFGYSVFNDWSARDEQMKAMGGAINIGPGAGKDFANSLGPCIVTADAIEDPLDLDMIARVNGAEVSRGNSSGMHYSFDDLIVHLTRANALYPGEILCSGTVGGGSAYEAGIELKSGDVIELEIEGIGRLSNPVIAPHMSGDAGDNLATANAVTDLIKKGK